MMIKHSTISGLFLIMTLTALFVQGCNRSPATRDELTDRYLDRLFKEFFQGHKSYARFSNAKTPREKAAAIRYFSVTANEIASNIYKLDANNVYPEAIEFGNTVADWAKRESEQALKMADLFDQQASGKKPDIKAAISHGIGASVRQKSLNTKAIEIERNLKEKFGYQNKTLSDLVAKLNKNGA